MAINRKVIHKPKYISPLLFLLSFSSSPLPQIQPPMLAPRLLRITTKPPPPNLRAVTLRTTRRLSLTPASKMKDSTKSCSPPAHAMAYFPNMTTALPSSSGEFRKVLWTGLFSQVVLMTVPVGGDIGDEVHLVDQALTFTSGQGMATINGQSQKVKAGDLMVVPAGTQHQFINTGPTPLVS